MLRARRAAPKAISAHSVSTGTSHIALSVAVELVACHAGRALAVGGVISEAVGVDWSAPTIEDIVESGTYLASSLRRGYDAVGIILPSDHMNAEQQHEADYQLHENILMQ